MNRRAFSISAILAATIWQVPLFRHYFPNRVQNGWILKDDDV